MIRFEVCVCCQLHQNLKNAPEMLNVLCV